MIKHEEVLKELNKIYNEPFNILKLDNAPLSAVPEFANFAKKIYQYITEQEKKDELLELYKEKISVLENSKYLNRFSRSFDDVEVTKLSSVTTKISKLEEEMK